MPIPREVREQRRVRLVVGLAVAAGAAAVPVVLDTGEAGVGPVPVIAGLAALMTLAHAFPLYLPRETQGEDLNLEEGVVALMLLLLPPAGVLVAATAAGAVGHAVRRRDPLKRLFDHGIQTLGVGVAVVVQHAIRPPGDGPVGHLEALAAAAGVCGFTVVISLFVWGVIAAAGGRRFRDVALPAVPFAILASGVALTSGLLAAVAARQIWWAPLLGLVPLVAVGRILTSLQRAEQDRRRLGGLVRTAEETAGAVAKGSVGESVVAAARELLRVGRAEVRAGRPGPGELGARLTSTGEERWLVVGDRHPLDPFNDADQALLDGMAALASTALDNAFLLEQVSHQALHDALTGLPNRALFADRVSQAITHAERVDEEVAVVYLDLDRFKRVNDSLGHTQGDELLCQVAARIVAAVRPTDTVCRMGGDEFTILLPGVGATADLAPISDRLMESVRHPFEVGGQPIFVTASVGVAVFPQDGTDVGSLLRAADAAMYQAKSAGRDGVSLSTPVDGGDDVLALEAALHAALRRDELWVAYQPLVDLRSDRVVGFEALVRWHHPDLGTVPPDRFLPVAEESGLIVDIDTWVLRTATRQAGGWRAAGHDVHVAVNVSSRTLRTPAFEGLVAAALADAGLPPGGLELEITERVAADEPAQIVDRLARLRALGVRVSIDDFGTGYSSLSRIQSFPVDRLKIDRSFVRRITSRDDRAPIAAATLAMAHSLGLVVTAEGVETDEQLDFLRSQGCDSAQGFLLGKPMPAAAATSHLAARAVERRATGGLVTGDGFAASGARLSRPVVDLK